MNGAAKLSFVAGLGVGYVLGARAGRERYRQIVGKADQIWHDPRVQQKAEDAQNLAKDAGAAAASAVAEKATEAASKVAATAKEKVHSVTHSSEKPEDLDDDLDADLPVGVVVEVDEFIETDELVEDLGGADDIEFVAPTPSSDNGRPPLS